MLLEPLSLVWGEFIPARGAEKDREAPELGALALLGCRDCSARKDIVELEFQSLKQRRYQGVPRTERAG